MDYQNIILEIDGPKAKICLNRPEVFHALNASILEELASAFQELGENETIRVITLTATGAEAFCSGADLKEGMANAGRPLGEILAENYEPLIIGIRECPKPVICQMNGIAAGAGMSLALACDLIIANDKAYMTELFVGIGLMPDAGSMYFLPRLVGVQKAFELCSTGRKIYMEEALQLGLVSKVAPENELEATVNQLTDYYASAPTVAIAQMKKVLNLTYESSLQQMLASEAKGQTRCGFTEDFGEGVMAFLQKRKPEFKGK
ncbi:enoyl-CoA hydratase/isomerase family protein [Jiulongibacter sediminis]|jgi:2-(1,2-epoxy-1,2-dihydrophenyl)acetyl-CoA isomerase|uniref:enoyl-CoA hydratase/isomerase family protein n=1 Tax=Jiulongibacter sediminis TaxID=1605367 RepID=UPI0026EFE055|nr:enoyl-CoA hydratase-related protein [Jiulongibacter sediminis]